VAQWLSISSPEQVMSDSWCAAMFYRGKWISGGAARNVRIAAAGGMDAVLHEVAFNAGRDALIKANRAAAARQGSNVIQFSGTMRARRAA
jgi:hypothetical protein